jgi:hypothetical protein
MREWGRLILIIFPTPPLYGVFIIEPTITLILRKKKYALSYS